MLYAKNFPNVFFFVVEFLCYEVQHRAISVAPMFIMCDFIIVGRCRTNDGVHLGGGARMSKALVEAE